MSETLNPLSRAWVSSKPIPKTACREAAPGDLLDWLERITARVVIEEHQARQAHRDGKRVHQTRRYVFVSRQRVRSEIERRMAT